MFCVDDYIIYDGKGVCKVLDNNVTQLKDIQTERTYYKLSPIYETGIIYIPVDTDVFMRPVVSQKGAEDILYGELATSLGISRDSVVPYIEETLSKNKADKKVFDKISAIW